MFRTLACFLGLCLAMSAPPALACLPSLVECPLGDGRQATLYSHFATGVLFSESSADGTAPSRTVLVECQSRRALAIPEPQAQEARDYAAYELLTEALNSRAAVTLRQLALDIRALGVEAQIFTLPEGHCGCDLPAIDPDYVTCPGF